MLDFLKSFRWQDTIDILIVAYIIYRIILLIKGTRAVQMLVGITILVIIYFGARELEFLTLYWLFSTFLSSIFLIIIIIFQRDIRKALTQVGQTPFTKSYKETIHALTEIVKAVQDIADRKLGSLIIIERETGLQDYIESGHTIDAALSRQLLVSMLLVDSPLHDGGIVIRKDRITSAGCVLPLTRNPYIDKRLGTRHRAAIGLSEETDAIIIVVSAETQQISLVQHGTITTNLNENELRNHLDAIFVPREPQTQLRWKSWLSKS